MTPKYGALFLLAKIGVRITADGSLKIIKMRYKKTKVWDTVCDDLKLCRQHELEHINLLAPYNNLDSGIWTPLDICRDFATPDLNLAAEISIRLQWSATTIIKTIHILEQQLPKINSWQVVAKATPQIILRSYKTENGGQAFLKKSDSDLLCLSKNDYVTGYNFSADAIDTYSLLVNQLARAFMSYIHSPEHRDLKYIVSVTDDSSKQAKLLHQNIA